MNDQEIDFEKYRTKGAGYHWVQSSTNPFRMNSFVRERYRQCLELLSKQNKQLRGAKVLDLGCGDGVLTYALNKAGARASGIDLSEIAVSYARKKHKSLKSNAEFVVGSCYATGFADESFDGVVSSDVIEHLADPILFLRETYRILKKGGTCVISTPIKVTEEPLDKMHFVEWFPGEFKQLIAEVFVEAEFHYSHPLAWLELMQYSTKMRVIINLLSLLWNPFLVNRRWRFPSMQYAVCRKV